MVLLIGFDSAWTPGNSGALIGVVRSEDGGYRELGPPLVVNFPQATETIFQWQTELRPQSTIVMLDQPTIVPNEGGQRPVENIACSPVSLRYGGMQPANTGRSAMFGPDAPVRVFLSRFGGSLDPLDPGLSVVVETYPVLAMIALGWILPDSRPTGRLPKYNPDRRPTFEVSDWQFVCGRLAAEFRRHELRQTAQWLDAIRAKSSPRKSDQDGIDACFCLLVAIHFAAGEECLVIGDQQTGYILVPNSPVLRNELEKRCIETGRGPSEWVRVSRYGKGGSSVRAHAPAPPPTSYQQMSAVERTLNGITKNREMQQTPIERVSRWSIAGIVARLNQHRQRATYGAVAGIIGGLPRGLMAGRTKCQEYSWVVAATGVDRGRPTGYDNGEIHPECLRQIQIGSPSVIRNAEELRRWLERHQAP